MNILAINTTTLTPGRTGKTAGGGAQCCQDTSVSDEKMFGEYYPLAIEDHRFPNIFKWLLLFIKAK